MVSPNIAVRGNVLLVEDDADSGDMMLTLLRNEGYNARLAKSRDSALMAVRQHRFDIVLIDVVMPGISLQEFIERLPATLRDRIVLMSALVDPEKIATSLKLKTWVRKPFDPNQLLEILNRLGSRSASQSGDSTTIDPDREG